MRGCNSWRCRRGLRRERSFPGRMRCRCSWAIAHDRSVEGERCFHRLDDLPEAVGGVVTVVPPSQTEKVIEDCARLGIKHVWMQQGSESETAVALCREKGIAEVHGQCLLMHTGAGFPHSIHRWMWRRLGRY